MGALFYLPSGTTLPPRMEECRPEMRDLECHGAGIQTASECRPCGSLVTLACPRCGVHRCESCALPGHRCPMCLLLEPRKYAMPEPARLEIV